jgi:hypothetical protein
MKRVEYVDDFDTTRRHQCRKYYITLVLSEGREDQNGDMELVHENHTMSAALVSAAALVCDVEVSVETPAAVSSALQPLVLGMRTQLVSASGATLLRHKHHPQHQAASESICDFVLSPPVSLHLHSLFSTSADLRIW